MKQHILSLAAIAVLAVASCKKDDDATTSNPNTNNTAAAFTWTENGGATQTADSAYWTSNSRYAGIRAYQGGAANFFEINWDSSSAVGAHPLGKMLTLIKGGSTVISSTSGTVNITANNSDKLTGTITSSVSGGGLQTVNCTFTALPKR